MGRGWDLLRLDINNLSQGQGTTEAERLTKWYQIDTYLQITRVLRPIEGNTGRGLKAALGLGVAIYVESWFVK